MAEANIRLTVTTRKPDPGTTCRFPVLPDWHQCGAPAFVTVEVRAKERFAIDHYCERHAGDYRPA